MELAFRPDPSSRVCSIPSEGPQKASTPSFDALTTADPSCITANADRNPTPLCTAASDSLPLAV